MARRPIALRLAPRSAADRREHAAPTGLPLLPPSRPHAPPPAARGTRVFADPIRIRSTFVRKLLPRVRFDFDGKRKPAVTAGTGWHLSFGDSTHFDLGYARASASADDTRRIKRWVFWIRLRPDLEPTNWYYRMVVGGRAPALAYTVSAAARDGTVMVRCDYYCAPSGYWVGSMLVFASYEA